MHHPAMLHACTTQPNFQVDSHMNMAAYEYGSLFPLRLIEFNLSCVKTNIATPALPTCFSTDPPAFAAARPLTVHGCQVR